MTLDEELASYAHTETGALRDLLIRCRQEIGTLQSQQEADIVLIRKYKTLSEQYHDVLQIVRGKLARAKLLMTRAMEYGLNANSYSAHEAREIGDQMHEFLAGRAAAEGSAVENGESKSGAGSQNDEAERQAGR